MKKIILSLATLAALSTASFAERTDIDPRDRNDHGSSVAMIQAGSAGGTSSLLAVEDATAGMSNFDRVNAQSAENENGGN